MLAANACFAAECRLGGLEQGHVTALKNETDIGMGDEFAAAADDIGIPGFADGEIGDHIADVLEVDFGLEYADDVAGETLDGHGDGHVRFGAAHEVNGSEKRFALFGVEERRRDRKIFLDFGKHCA